MVKVKKEINKKVKKESKVIKKKLKDIGIMTACNVALLFKVNRVVEDKILIKDFFEDVDFNGSDYKLVNNREIRVSLDNRLLYINNTIVSKEYVDGFLQLMKHIAYDKCKIEDLLIYEDEKSKSSKMLPIFFVRGDYAYMVAPRQELF